VSGFKMAEPDDLNIQCPKCGAYLEMQQLMDGECYACGAKFKKLFN